MLRSLVLCTVVPLALSSFGCAPAERAETGEIESAGAVDAFALRVGDCFDDQSGSEVLDVPGVPCSEPHDNEIYAVFDLQGNEWPGKDVVSSLAEEGCFERFEAAIGASYEESVLVFWPLIPTEGSWRGRKDREVLCAAYHMDLEKLTGSVLASGM
jgi:hypothetical protein